MEVTNNTKKELNVASIIANIFISIFALVFELICAAIIFAVTGNKCNFKNIVIIFITNIVVNLIFVFSIAAIPLPIILSTIILGILMTFLEYCVYKKYFIDMSNMSKKNILLYTFFINIVSIMVLTICTR